MGLFGRFVYSEGEWRDEAAGNAYLAIDIHDSDIATVEYRPAPGQGRFYLGFQPRDYFEDPDASETVEADAEVDGLVRWAQRVLGIEVVAAQVRPLLAEDGTIEPADDFVEETTVRFIRLLGLPLPAELDGLVASARGRRSRPAAHDDSPAGGDSWSAQDP